MMRPGSAGSNTAADHLKLLDEAIAALPAPFRRKLMVTCDGAGASHDLVKRLDKLASRRGYELVYSVGWALTEREKTSLRLVPGTAWEAAIDAGGKVRERRSEVACGNDRCGHRACWILDRRSTRHRADRAATQGPGRRPAEGLAEDDAGLRPPRASASRRAAHLVRGGRRVALHPVGDEPARGHEGLARPVRLHRRRPPGPRPHRGREGSLGVRRGRPGWSSRLRSSEASF
jgi:hypothetical protein